MLQPIARTNLFNLQYSFEQLGRGPNASKAKGTFLSRQQHFVDWCKEIEIDPTMHTIVVNSKNRMIALYALYLSQGETLLCGPIKAKTIERYLYAAAKLSIAVHQMDPRLDIFGKTSEHIKKVLR